MRQFRIDYRIPPYPMADFIFNNHTRRIQKDDVATLPGLKPSTKTPSNPTHSNTILRAMCKSFDVSAEMQTVIFNLLVGSNNAGDWKIAGVYLASGCLTLRLANISGERLLASIHGSQFQDDTIELRFEGMQDELILDLNPCTIRGCYMNDLMNDVFELRSPSSSTQRVWDLSFRAETVW